MDCHLVLNSSLLLLASKDLLIKGLTVGKNGFYEAKDDYQ